VNEPINREDKEHCIKQPPRRTPKVHESNLKHPLQEVTVIGDCKSNNAGRSKHWMYKHCKTSFKTLIQGFIINFLELEMKNRLAFTGARN